MQQSLSWRERGHAKMKQNLLLLLGVSELSLHLDDKKCILLGDWLTDKHISAANQLLKKGFPQCKGLDNPIFGGNFSLPILR